MLEPDDFTLGSVPSVRGRKPLAAGTHLDDLEREAVVRALKDHKHNISRAAAALGVTRASLYRRMQKYGL